MRFRFPAIAVLRSSSVIATSYDGSEYPQTIQIVPWQAPLRRYSRPAVTMRVFPFPELVG